MGNNNCYCSKNLDPNQLSMMQTNGEQPLQEKDQDNQLLALQARMKSPRVSRLVDSLNESKRKMKYGGGKLNEDMKASPKRGLEANGFQPDFHSQYQSNNN